MIWPIKMIGFVDGNVCLIMEFVCFSVLYVPSGTRRMLYRPDLPTKWIQFDDLLIEHSWRLGEHTSSFFSFFSFFFPLFLQRSVLVYNTTLYNRSSNSSSRDFSKRMLWVSMNNFIEHFSVCNTHARTHIQQPWDGLLFSLADLHVSFDLFFCTNGYQPPWD